MGAPRRREGNDGRLWRTKGLAVVVTCRACDAKVSVVKTARGGSFRYLGQDMSKCVRLSEEVQKHGTVEMELFDCEYIGAKVDRALKSRR